LIKNNKAIYSYRDAQGFRKDDNIKLDVKQVDAFVYHYGWVRKPEVMMSKIRNASAYYEDIKWIQEVGKGQQSFDYSSIDALKLFDGTHPAVMTEHIKRKNWNFEHDISFNKLPLKYKGKIFLRKYLGINTFYENFRIIK
jgi:hypothetical protein